MLALAPLLWLAAAQDKMTESEARVEAENRAAARKVLQQLVAEDPAIHHGSDHRGHDEVWIDTRPRASNRRGICQIDRLEIERDSAAGIRRVDTKRWFLVLTDDAGKPRRGLEGEGLEKSCAAAEWSARWFEAPEAFAAEAAVAGLLGLKTELGKPQPMQGTWGCRKGRACPDPKAIAEKIDALVPEGVAEGGHSGVPCPEGKYCVSVILRHTSCDNWVTQLRLDRSGDFRFHSARAAYPLYILHCGDPHMGS